MAAGSNSVLDSVLADTALKIPENVLTDLVCRFTTNVPEEEKTDLIRMCFQIELAHWFFIDNYCQPGTELFAYGHIPFNIFLRQMFEHTPFLRKFRDQADKAVLEFQHYKRQVPVYGAILLTKDLNEVLLVQGFRNQWGFPKGKMNKEEDPVICAAREVKEETGYDIKPLVKSYHFIESTQNDRTTRLYIVVGVDRNYTFRPLTAYEIKAISWFTIDELPENRRDTNFTCREGYTSGNFYTVHSFVRRLKRWIQDKKDGQNQIHNFRSTGNHPQDQNQNQPQHHGQHQQNQGSNQPVPLSTSATVVRKDPQQQQQQSIPSLLGNFGQNLRKSGNNAVPTSQPAEFLGGGYRPLQQSNYGNNPPKIHLQIPIQPKAQIKRRLFTGEGEEDRTNTSTSTKYLGQGASPLGLGTIKKEPITPPVSIAKPTAYNLLPHILNEFKPNRSTMNIKKEKDSSFFNGPGCQEWLNFHLDIGKILDAIK